MKVLNKKNITDNGYVLANFYSQGSVVFIADIPENAVVDAVKVNGKFLDDLISSDVKYPRTLKDGHYRVVAVVNNCIGYDLYSEAESSGIESFEVYYHEEAVVTV